MNLNPIPPTSGSWANARDAPPWDQNRDRLQQLVPRAMKTSSWWDRYEILRIIDSCLPELSNGLLRQHELELPLDQMVIDFAPAAKNRPIKHLHSASGTF
jgi:hypothetical protein